MEITAVAHYLEYTKRAHFMALLEYTRDRKALIAKLTGLKGEAEAMYIKNLLTRMLERWKDNVLVPKQRLLKEVDSYHTHLLLRGALESVKAKHAQFLEVDLWLRQRDETRLLGYLTIWRTQTGTRVLERRLRELCKSVNTRALSQCFGALLERYNGVRKHETALHGIGDRRVAFQAFSALRERQRTADLEREALQMYEKRAQESIAAKVAESLLKRLRERDEVELQRFLELQKQHFVHEMALSRQQRFQTYRQTYLQERASGGVAFRPGETGAMVVPDMVIRTPATVPRAAPRAAEDVTSRIQPVGLTGGPATAMGDRNTPRTIEPLLVSQLSARRVAPMMAPALSQERSKPESQPRADQLNRELELKQLAVQIEKFKQLEKTIKTKQQQIVLIEKQIAEYKTTEENKYSVEMQRFRDQQQVAELRKEVSEAQGAIQQSAQLLRAYREKQ